MAFHLRNFPPLSVSKECARWIADWRLWIADFSSEKGGKGEKSETRCRERRAEAKKAGSCAVIYCKRNRRILD
jgi:hypothetical protein